MATWTLPIIVADVRTSPRPSPMGPHWPNRNFGLIGMLTITQNGNLYTGTLLLTKPATSPNIFAGTVYAIDSQYITMGNSGTLMVTVPKAATDCQANFLANGNLSQQANNPPLFDTATVDGQGTYHAGNLTLPNFTFKGTWDTAQNTITNGEIWVPYRFLWAIWGDKNQSQTPWKQIQMTFAGSNTPPWSSTNSTVFSYQSSPAIMAGSNAIPLLSGTGSVVLKVDLTGITLGAYQGIALSLAVTNIMGPLYVFIGQTADPNGAWSVLPAGFDQPVANQNFFVPVSMFPSTPFYLQIQNTTGTTALITQLGLAH